MKSELINASNEWLSKSKFDKTMWLGGFMGEEWMREHTIGGELKVDCACGYETRVWDPLCVWGDWRDVEEKIMNDDHLWAMFTFMFDIENGRTEVTKEDIAVQWFHYCHADLPTRGRALFLASNSKL